jgi:OOP family OmpA-OmpF porin
MLRYLALPLLLLIAACQTVPPAPASPYSAEQVAVLKHYAFEQSGDEWLLGMDGKLLFPTDESSVAEDQAETIGQMARALLAVGIHGTRVEGHTDSTGSTQYNHDLSLRRAEAVKQALVAGGMADAQVEAVGKGASQPVESNRTAQGRSENRRVAIIVAPANVLPY